MPRPVAFACLALLCGACGDIEVRSIRTGDIVPAQLEGEWRGAWQSHLTGINGLLTMRIQDFDGAPVVAVQIAHPCVPPSQYQFRATANSVQLLDDDVVLFEAVLGDERVLVGTYDCLADSGSWDASWQRDLPELVDLSGRWVGTVTASGFPAQVLELQFAQTVRDGSLVLDGAMTLPGLVDDPLPVIGQVQFGDTSFDILLVTEPGTVPLVHMTAAGDTATRAIANGQLQAAVDPLLPVVEASWHVQWLGP